MFTSIFEMNRKRLILYLVFVVYQLGAFTFTYMVDGHLDLLGLLKYIPWFKYITFLGMVLIIVDVAWYLIDHRTNHQENKDLKAENTDLKAKIYDLREAARKADAPKGV